MSNTFTCRKCKQTFETSVDTPCPIAEFEYKLRVGSDHEDRAVFDEVLWWHFCPDCGVKIVKMLEEI